MAPNKTRPGLRAKPHAAPGGREPQTIPSSRFSDPTGRVLYFNIVGPSMRPTLKSGDLLIVVPYGRERMKRGDIVVFSPPHEKRLITHRLVFRRGDRWRARGDNNSRVDPWPLTAENIIGKVTHVWRWDSPRRLASGRRGRAHGFVMRGVNALRQQLFQLIRPAYRWVAGRGLFRGIWPAPSTLKVMSVTRPDGAELRLLWRKAVIGKLPPHQSRWWIRPPFRLLIDESRLPNADMKR